MTWDTSSPADSDFISLGDDVIRAFKTDIQTALRGNAADGTEAKFPGSDTANPVFRYRGLKGTTGARPASGQYGLYFDTTRQVLQRDNGSSWEDIAGGVGIVSGVKMIFYQASAPTGWTAVAVNDKFLRVVTAGGTGGSTGGSVAASTSLAHAHGITTESDHKHVAPIFNLAGTVAKLKAGSSGPFDTATVGGTTPTYQGVATTSESTHDSFWNTLSAGGHNHGGSTDSQLGGAFAYADVVIATKD